MSNTIMVFTQDSADDIKRAGGSGAWRIDAKRASRAEYLVCVKNDPRSPDHGSAFLIGRISAVTPREEGITRPRYVIEIDAFVDLHCRSVWHPSWQNPVRYSDLEAALGTDPRSLKFEPMPPK